MLPGSSQKIKTGIIATASVGAITICGFAIVLLVSKKGGKEVEQVAEYKGLSALQETRGAGAIKFPENVGRKSSEPKYSKESKGAAGPAPPERKATDSPDQKPKPADSLTPSPEAPLSPRGDSKSNDKAGAKKAESPELPVWKVDPDLLKNLGREIRVGPYLVRPPKGYEKVIPPQDPRGLAEAYWWASKPRADGTRAQFSVLIITVPPGTENNLAPLEQMHETNLEKLREGKENWQQHPAERGLLAGLIFLRSRWSGTHPTLGKMHGFRYHAVDGSYIVEISSQDVEPHHERALKIAEAAGLTFRKPK